MKTMFTWIEAHHAIAIKLQAYRDNQQELIDILQQAGVDKFDDEVVQGVKSKLLEIDPFTFFSYIYKHGSVKNKKVLREVCRLFNINVDVKDVCGNPTPFAMNVWYFPYKYERVNDEIDRLWNFFDKLMTDTITDYDFQDILRIRGIGKPKLMDGLYRIKPYKYLCFNGVVNSYLEKKGINPVFEKFSELKDLQVRVQNDLNLDFPKLSYDAYLDALYSYQPSRYFRIGCKDGSNGTSLLSQMLDNNVVSIGWYDLGDIEDVEPITKAEITKELVLQSFYKEKKVASRKAGEILTFYEEIKPYDYILVADGMAIKAIGRVISENYFFEPSFYFPHCRNVEWIKTDINDLHIDEGLLTSVWEYEYPQSIKAIEAYLGIRPIEPDTTPEKSENNKPERGKPKPSPLPKFPLNIILYGPPGTGKTFQTIDKAIEIIKGTKSTHVQNKEEFDRLKAEGRIAFVTFHQNYAYEDFMVGIKPDTDPKNSQLSFRQHEGIFYKLVKKAKDAYDAAQGEGQPDRFVLIIDEINRANISRVFGELITLLEDDKRLGGDNELAVTLPNGESFGVPPNLYVVGTMNTADKSIALIDIALRRRFEFIGMYPDTSVLVGRFSDRIPFLQAINKKIYEKRKSADYLIGHAYLLKEGDLEEIIERKIIPLLMEYFNGRTEDVISLFEGSGYTVKYNEADYKWNVDLKPVNNEVEQESDQQ